MFECPILFIVRLYVLYLRVFQGYLKLTIFVVFSLPVGIPAAVREDCSVLTMLGHAILHASAPDGFCRHGKKACYFEMLCDGDLYHK